MSENVVRVSWRWNFRTRFPRNVTVRRRHEQRARYTFEILALCSCPLIWVASPSWPVFHPRWRRIRWPETRLVAQKDFMKFTLKKVPLLAISSVIKVLIKILFLWRKIGINEDTIIDIEKSSFLQVWQSTHRRRSIMLGKYLSKAISFSFLS